MLIGEAMRRLKLGVTEDSWKRINREKIANEDECKQKAGDCSPASWLECVPRLRAA